jgi:hypothetical protein
MKTTAVLFLALLLSSTAGLRAGIVVLGQNSTTALAYAGATSATDLINAGQATLASAAVTPSHGSFSGNGINDGVYANSPLTANTFFQYDIHFPATATFELNLTGAPHGYDLASIDSFMGWATVSQRQANQDYTVEVSVVGSDGFRPLVHVKYTPFSGNGGNYETRVTITEDTTGVLAANVDAIRFLFADPGNNGSTPGTLVREMDVQGAPSAAAPPAVAVQTVADFSETDGVYAGEVVNNDLVNNGQATLASFTTSTTPQFNVGGQNNGTYGLANAVAAAWYKPAQLPATLTFELNTNSASTGYVITAIRTFAGWKNGGTQTYANQKYGVEYRNVGSADWTPLESVDYSPFSSLVNTSASTRVVLSAPAGNLRSGVAALRFNFQVPTRADGVNNGTVLQEIDVVGYPVDTPPEPTVTIRTPAERFLVQRTAANTGAIPITGTYPATPDRIEARAVVMAGANSGTTTDWQTIKANPGGGAFSGILTNVPAGGWYQLEVRSVTGPTPSATATRTKVGVGDIYLTAGQSNSANHGAPTYTPADDRVCARLAVSGSSWRQGYDPMPIATGTGGSPWSRLGALLAAADNLPVGFLCVGVGATQVSEWQPGTANYDSLLKPALQSLGTGFRAVLWHQGESDSIANVTAANHAALLATMIARSRQDAGWTVPWYVAEVSFHPATYLSQEAPVTAGQRLAAYADANVFLGASTDWLHLEDANGGKLADTVHFNAAGLTDHATQWRDILRGTTSTAPRNGNFEDNRTAALTGLAPLADGASHIVNISSDTDSPSVIGWHILSASGVNAAAGVNGFHNPTVGTYAAAVDTISNGVLPNMSGRHVAVLNGGSAGNFFLHTTRALAQPLRVYTLRAALGVRDYPASFGGARLDILAKGQVVASASFDKAALDALRGGNAAGAFTEVSLAYTTGEPVPANQPLAIRIAKTGGAGTVLDFDNVRFTSASNHYGAWQVLHWGSTSVAAAAQWLDPDGDRLANGIEYFLGYDPISPKPRLQPTLISEGNHEWGRFAVPLDPAVTDAGLGLDYSFDLETWLPAATAGDGSVVHSKAPDFWRLDIDRNIHPQAFYRLTLGPIVPLP